MANPTEFNPIQKRNLLYSPKATESSLRQTGDAFFEKKRFYDAFQFYVVHKDAQGLGKIKAKGLELGDPFLLNLVAQATPEAVTPADWKQVAEIAEKGGRTRYAAWAYEEAGEKEKGAELAQKSEKETGSSANISPETVTSTGS